jgi:hypothetical protein
VNTNTHTLQEAPAAKPGAREVLSQLAKVVVRSALRNAASVSIKRWEKVGEDRATLQTRREVLLEAVTLRLEDPVPEPIRLAIEGTNDLATLLRWHRAALTVGTIADFLPGREVACEHHVQLDPG